MTTTALICKDNSSHFARIHDKSRHDCWQDPMFMSPFVARSYISEVVGSLQPTDLPQSLIRVSELKRCLEKRSSGASYRRPDEHRDLRLGVRFMTTSAAWF